MAINRGSLSLGEVVKTVKTSNLCTPSHFSEPSSGLESFRGQLWAPGFMFDTTALAPALP